MFASILYPVMGPAIRRSIAQSLKDLTQQINQALEQRPPDTAALEKTRAYLIAERRQAAPNDVLLQQINTLLARIDRELTP